MSNPAVPLVQAGRRYRIKTRLRRPGFDFGRLAVEAARSPGFVFDRLRLEPPSPGFDFEALAVTAA